MTDLKPFAWVMPGDDTAHPDGWIDCRAERDGEFTTPVYRGTELDALRVENANLRSEVERLQAAEVDEADATDTRIAEHEAELARVYEIALENRAGRSCSYCQRIIATDRDVPSAPTAQAVSEAFDEEAGYCLTCRGEGTIFDHGERQSITCHACEGTGKRQEGG